MSERTPPEVVAIGAAWENDEEREGLSARMMEVG